MGYSTVIVSLPLTVFRFCFPSPQRWWNNAHYVSGGVQARRSQVSDSGSELKPLVEIACGVYGRSVGLGHSDTETAGPH